NPVPLCWRQVCWVVLIGILSSLAFLTSFTVYLGEVRALINRIRREGQLNSTSTQAPKEVAGFYPYWNLSTVAELDLTNLSTVYYFAVHLKRDGTFNDNDPGISGLNSETANPLRKTPCQKAPARASPFSTRPHTPPLRTS